MSDIPVKYTMTVWPGSIYIFWNSEIVVYTIPDGSREVMGGYDHKIMDWRII